MYLLKPTGKFKKDLKLCKKRGYDLTNIEKVLEYLQRDGQVPLKYKPHKLINYNDFWECHIGPDWLLIYDIQDTINIIALVRTGSHSDLF